MCWKTLKRSLWPKGTAASDNNYLWVCHYKQPLSHYTSSFFIVYITRIDWFAALRAKAFFPGFSILCWHSAIVLGETLQESPITHPPPPPTPTIDDMSWGTAAAKTSCLLSWGNNAALICLEILTLLQLLCCCYHYLCCTLLPHQLDATSLLLRLWVLFKCFVGNQWRRQMKRFHHGCQVYPRQKALP